MVLVDRARSQVAREQEQVLAQVLCMVEVGKDMVPEVRDKAVLDHRLARLTLLAIAGLRKG
jgi:hypothetical protein